MESINSDLELAPYLLLELAANIYPIDELADRWGVPLPHLKMLSQHPAIRRQIEQKRSELESSGMTFRMKAAAATEIILQHVVRRAQDPEVSLSSLLDSGRWTSQMADLIPRQNALGGPGTGYQLTINLGGSDSTTITAIKPLHVVDPESLDILNDADPLSHAPRWLTKVKSVPVLNI